MAEQESDESVTPKPAKKRKCLSLSRKKKKTLSPSSRFSTMVGDDEICCKRIGEYYIRGSNTITILFIIKFTIHFFHLPLTILIHLLKIIKIKMGGGFEGAVYILAHIIMSIKNIEWAVRLIRPRNILQIDIQYNGTHILTYSIMVHMHTLTYSIMVHIH